MQTPHVMAQTPSWHLVIRAVGAGKPLMGSLITARKPHINATPWRDSSEAQLTSEDQSSGGREAPVGQSHQSQKTQQTHLNANPGMMAQKPS